jgi:hypothetical protein
LALSYNRWWVVIFLEYIITSHMDSVDRLCGHKAEIWYSE